jgi:hypothetical protein
MINIFPPQYKSYKEDKEVCKENKELFSSICRRDGVRVLLTTALKPCTLQSFDEPLAKFSCEIKQHLRLAS